ncbi:hypothetical protein BKD26_34360 [Streptomyces sp. CB03238]|nr:hypothetical protein BKD26_34360 [Streptomyces sp. CB03238]
MLGRGTDECLGESMMKPAFVRVLGRADGQFLQRRQHLASFGLPGRLAESPPHHDFAALGVELDPEWEWKRRLLGHLVLLDR